MCGIVGVGRTAKTGLGTEELEVFIDLLIADSLRGDHGTGIISVDDRGKAKTLKIGGTPFDLMRSEQWTAFWKPVIQDGKFLIGHNRYATTGKRTTANSHPFIVDNIVMVHNGTLDASSNMEDLKKFDVDSHALCSAIAKEGVDAAIAKTLGAYAIVYYDTKEETINFLRNSERPLFLGIDKKWDRFFFASERMMMDWILVRNRIKLAEVEIEAVPVNRLITIPLNKLEITDREVKGQAPKKFYTPVWQGNSYPAAPQSGTGGTVTCHSSPPYVNYTTPTKQDGIIIAGAELSRKQQKRERKAALKNGGKIVNDTRNGNSYIIAATIKGMKKNDLIIFKPVDYLEEDKNNDRYIIVGHLKNDPSVEVMCHIKGSEGLDDIFEAGAAKAQIKTLLLEYTAGKKQKDYRDLVWVANMEPHYASTTH